MYPCMAWFTGILVPRRRSQPSTVQISKCFPLRCRSLLCCTCSSACKYHPSQHYRDCGPHPPSIHLGNMFAVQSHALDRSMRLHRSRRGRADLSPHLFQGLNQRDQKNLHRRRHRRRHPRNPSLQVPGLLTSRPSTHRGRAARLQADHHNLQEQHEIQQMPRLSRSLSRRGPPGAPFSTFQPSIP